MQLHRHDYVISPEHHSSTSPYNHHHHHQHLPPPQHHQLYHHHHHPDDGDSIYRSGDKLATRDAQSESLDATITQLKNFPCSAGDIQLHKLLQRQQQQQQQLCDIPDAEYFYAPRLSFGSCPLDASTASTTPATVVGLSSNVAFYGEVLQAMEDRDGHQERKCLVQAGRCQFRVGANDRLTPTPPTSAGIHCDGAVTSGKLKNCPIDLA